MTGCSELGEGRRCQQESGYPSQPTQEAAVFTIANRSHEPVKFFWLDRSGVRALYATLPPGGHVDQQTHVGWSRLKMVAASVFSTPQQWPSGSIRTL
jgi:hypothetical protein